MPALVKCVAYLKTGLNRSKKHVRILPGRAQRNALQPVSRLSTTFAGTVSRIAGKRVGTWEKTAWISMRASEAPMH
jgi:hypothetical protein